MKTFTYNLPARSLQSAFRSIFLFALMLCTFSSFAQQYRRVYAATQTNSSASHVTLPLQALNGDLTNFSTLSFPTSFLGGSRYQQLTFPATAGNAPVSTDPVHVKFGIDGGLLALGGTIEIQAYNGNSEVGDPTDIGELLSLLGGEAIYDVVIPAPGATFTSIRITTSSIVNLGTSLNIYEAYINKTATTDIACNGKADEIYGSTAALVGGLNAVTDPANAVDGNDATFAVLRANVSLLTSKSYVTGILNAVAPANDLVRIVAQNPAGLLSASVLSSNIRITTYLGNVGTSIFGSSPLITLSLLSGTSSVYEILIPSSVAFDRIEVSVGGGLVNALSTLNVYEIGSAFATPTITAPNVTIYAGQTATLAATTSINTDGVLWEHTSPDYSSTDNPYTTPILQATTTYTVKATRTGCTERSAAATATVTVLPITLATLPNGTLSTNYVFGTPLATSAGRTLAYAYTGTGLQGTGLSVDPTTGVLSGTPLKSGTFTFDVKITDTTGGGSIDAGTYSFTVTIVTNLAIVGGPYPAGRRGSAYSQQLPAGLGASQGIAPYSYVIIPPGSGGARVAGTLALPDGLTLTTAGLLSGTPTEVGTNTFTVQATDAEGSTIQANFTVQIEEALPVTLVSFSTVKEGQSALLKWSTSAETNSDRFEIERSQNGKSWGMIGTKKSNGESLTLKNYNFTDAEPLSGENLYRLKMVDHDGTFAYSKIESLTFEGLSTSFYPNPVAEKLLINTVDINKVKTVQIFDASGRAVYQSSTPTKEINVQNLASGLYVIKMTQKSGTVVSGKIVKQ